MVVIWAIFVNYKNNTHGFEDKADLYYEYYQYKEVDSEGFVRFAKYHFDLEDNAVFEDWILLK
ncbi:hypothetical protein IEO70_05820 [Bacillus sp. AGMB 02131]|uniref:Uncharacterized protein n=1 Tax=Peribacillus faecalis TaxID=2772559 RepID=A0A927CUM8_9BACI|nr:hypothetical protein [Peribacillus faecalis]MBD3107878.1 hypothetical protein [Peribacillus faecalis]